MSTIIGHFIDAPDDRLVGTVKTLNFSGQVEWRPNHNKASDRDPDLIGLHGDVRLGRAYQRTTRSSQARTYFRAYLDDPSFTSPIIGNIVQNQKGTWDFIFSRKSAASVSGIDNSSPASHAAESDAD